MNGVYHGLMIHKQLLSITAILAAIVSIVAVSVNLNSIHAEEGETFSASLSGKNEVPPTESNATGWAKFQTHENGTQISYWVNLSLSELTFIHIHNGSAGQNGDIVATLSGQESAEDSGSSTISLKGNMTKDDLRGPLEGKALGELVGLMRDGNAYVNVDTGDEFEKNEIRGQIVSGLPQMESNMGSPTESNNTSSNQR